MKFLTRIPRVGWLTLATLMVTSPWGSPRSVAAQQQSPPTASARPNILLIMADDIGREVLSSYGGTSYSTPHLDRLGAEGMRFERAYSTPLCTPTRVQIMTGKYNFRNYERFGYLPPRERTFANLLREAGYATAVAGKWQLGGDEKTPDGFGFDEYSLWQLKAPDHWTRYKDPVVTQNGKTEKLTGRYGPDVFAEFIESFMERNRDRPFFVYYPMALIHSPFQPTPDHPDFAAHDVEETNDTTYLPSMVRYMDNTVDRLVRKLDQLGVRENTLVLFVGDNGTNRKVTSRMGDRLIQGGKGLTINAGIHVPMIASWKGVIPPGQVPAELVDVVDFLPTLLDVAGVRPDTAFRTDGISFHNTLRTGAPHTRRWVFNDYDPRQDPEVRGPVRRYVMDKRYKLYADGTFYDYVQDPLEKAPLRADGLSPEARGIQRELQEVMDHMEAQIPPIERGPASAPKAKRQRAR